MTAQTEIGTLAVKVGEISGQLREMIHKQGNMEMKLDGLVERSLTAPTQADYEKLSARLDTAFSRIEALEAEKNRSDGARSVLASILGSKAFGVAMTALFGAYVAFKEGLFK